MRFLVEARFLACVRGLALLLSLCLLGMQAQASVPTIDPLFAFACGNNKGVCADGDGPNSLIQSADGNFYGTTTSGGTGNKSNGTVFKITPAAQLTILYNFVADQNGNYPNGAIPSSLVEGNDGFLYGTAQAGGANNVGVVFKLSKTGSFHILHNSVAPGGPSSLILANDGNLYGCTGPDHNFQNATAFRITPKGHYTILHTFNISVEGPGCIGIIAASDGNLYGTTIGGGGGGQKLTSLFRLTPAGQFAILRTIHYGQFPISAPIQAANGKLYGGLDFAEKGFPQPGLFKSNFSGTDYHEITLSYGSLNWVGGLADASDGNFWGVDAHLGTLGSIVNFAHDGHPLHAIAFDGTNGSQPEGLLQSSDGTIFGFAASGGSVGQGEVGSGVIFTLEPALPAPKPLFLTFNPSRGKVGSKVMIHGVHFVGSTAVTFNGVNATFQVLNTGNILATIPAGATTGKIAITNAGGTTSSSNSFVVQ